MLIGITNAPYQNAWIRAVCMVLVTMVSWYCSRCKDGALGIKVLRPGKGSGISTMTTRDVLMTAVFHPLRCSILLLPAMTVLCIGLLQFLAHRVLRYSLLQNGLYDGSVSKVLCGGGWEYLCEGMPKRIWIQWGPLLGVFSLLWLAVLPS